MSVYPTWAAGQRVTAALLTSMQMQMIQGTGTTNATTTLADAPGYVLAAEANASYYLRLVTSFDAPVATDIKFAWTAPAGASMTRSILAPQAGNATNLNTAVMMIRRSTGTVDQVGGPAGVANAFTTYLEDILLSTTTAGNVQLQFAAFAAGTATINSGFIIAQRLA